MRQFDASTSRRRTVSNGGMRSLSQSPVFLVALAVALFTGAETLSLSAAAQPVEDPNARVIRLQDAVLAPCCYTEPVSRHQSEVALKMRLEIARWVAAGRSDQSILGAYVERYGARVLVDPRTRPGVWTPWIPWSILIAGTFFCLWLVMRWQARSVPALAAGPDFANLPDLDESE
jgi:cytochrome c-type biogenesis protein CcmH/NrfF